MPPAELDQVAIDVTAGHEFRATWSKNFLSGYLQIYPEKSQETILPEVKKKKLLI